MVLAGLAVAFAAYALLARFVLHGSVTGRTLHGSVEQASGSQGATYDLGGDCRPRGVDGRWRCTVWDSAVSDLVAYEVRVRDGTSCWDAGPERPDAPSDLPRSLRGCVHRWQWTVF